MHWDDVRVFLTVVRTGSVAKAAGALGIDPTTVARRIDRLEGDLDTTLFTRRRDGWSRTAAGVAFTGRAERIDQEVGAAERELRGEDRRLAGKVRITAGDGLLRYALLPAVDVLRRDYPNIELEFRGETRTLDLSRREADLAVRLSRPTEEALVSRALGTVAFGLYASAEFLRRFGPPRTVADLRDYDFIGFGADLDGLPQVRWLHRQVGPVRYAIRTNTVALQVGACLNAVGIVLLPSYVAAHEPRLTPVLPSLAGPHRPVYVVVHEDMRAHARVSAVREWIASAISTLVVSEDR